MMILEMFFMFFSIFYRWSFFVFGSNEGQPRHSDPRFVKSNALQSFKAPSEEKSYHSSRFFWSHSLQEEILRGK
jgi:hypothetical protein